MTKPRSRLRDLSGTTLALTSLAILGAAAVVSAPVWLYYRRKRKRTDALLAEAAKAAAEAKATERPPALEPGPARDTAEGGPVPPSPSTPPPAPPTAGPSGS